MSKGKVTVVHNAPGKKGKQEYREFDSLFEAGAYIERNYKPKHRLGRKRPTTSRRGKGKR